MSRLRFTPLAALALCVGVNPSTPTASQRGSSFDRAIHSVDQFAREQVGAIGGMTVGVVIDGHLAWTASYGTADVERHEPASRATVYRIGSITKQITAVMLLQLTERGAVHLSDPVERHLPAITTVKSGEWRTSPITLYQLATMTSGLAQEPDNLDMYMRGDLSQWEQVLMAALAHTKLEHEPETTWTYSNIGYGALGAALGRAAKRPYAEYVRDEILRPLGMNHSSFELTPGVREHLATGYAIEDGRIDVEIPRREQQGRGYKVPNGGLYSTVDDLATFLAFEMGSGSERVLSAKTRKGNLSRLAWASADLNQAYGMGLHAVRRGGMVAFGHPGAVSGYRAAAYFDPQTASGVIVLRNSSSRRTRDRAESHPVGIQLPPRDDGKLDVLELCLRMLETVARSRQNASNHRN